MSNIKKGMYKSHSDEWKERDKNTNKIHTFKYACQSEEGELRNLPKDMVNVVGTLRAKEYYTKSIAGIEYIRPMSMKTLDGLDCEQISAMDAEALKICHDYSCGRLGVDLPLIEKYSEHETDLNERIANPLELKRFIDAEQGQNFALLDSYAKYSVRGFERFIKEGQASDEIRHFQMAAIYNQILFRLYMEYFLEPYFSIRKVTTPKRWEDELQNGDPSMVTVTRDFLEIGEIVKDNTYSEICQFDTWDEKRKNVIRQAVIGFVNRYGLLGILNNLFCNLDMFNPTNSINLYNLEQLEVLTCLDRMHSEILSMQTGYDLAVNNGIIPSEQNESNLFMLSRLYEVDTSMPASENGLSRTMKIRDYITLFFPTSDFMRNYTDFAPRDDRFWVKYSEPMYLFLLCAKVFYNKLAYTSVMVKSNGVKISGNENEGIETTHNIPSNILAYIESLNARIIFNYGESKLGVRETFYSLLDAISYYTYCWLAKGEQRVIVCAYCKRVAIVENIRSIYCTPSCNARSKAKRSRQKQKDKD